MLRTNLSTRPFYNDRAVHVGIVVVGVLAAALTTFNAAEILSLNDRNSELVSRAEASEGKARDLREQARKTMQSLNRTDVDAVQAAAKEANLLINRRAFSWTDLFNRFEETLPAEVRIVAVTPQIDREGRMLVASIVISQGIADLESFIDRLEDTGAFADVISRQDEAMDDGTLKSVVQGYYRQSDRRAAAVSSAPSSDSSDAEENASPSQPESPPSAGKPKPKPKSPEGGAR